MGKKTFGGWETYAADAWLDPAPAGGDYPVSTGTGYRSVFYKETTGFNTPNFRQRVAKGELIPFTPFMQYERKGQGKHEWDLYPNTWPTIGTHEYTVGNGIVLSTWYADDLLTLQGLAGTYSTDVYVQAAAAKLASGTFDALTFLSELRKTIEMFLKLGSKLLRLLRDPKFEWSAIVKAYKSDRGKSAADQWLEERYGWRTLIYDIEDFNDALKNLNHERSRRKERAGYKNSWTKLTTSTDSDPRRVLTNKWLHTYEVSARGSVVADIEPIRFQFNPLVTGWELIRFSFVIDWFISVGASLGALSFLILQNNYVAAGGIQIKDTLRFEREATATAGNYFTKFECLVESYSLYTLRSPCPVTTLPQIRLRLDTSKVIDLVALVIQTLARRK